jgi:hypothetical protein
MATGRPPKNNADYYPHHNNMRNNRKIKSLRKRFGHTGYSIYNMFLEFLTGHDYHKFQDNDLEIELLSGEFDISPEELRAIIEYCFTIDLLHKNEGYIYAKKLVERLQPLYEQRKRKRKGEENTGEGDGKQTELLMDGHNKQVEVSEGGLMDGHNKQVEVSEGVVYPVHNPPLNKTKLNKTKPDESIIPPSPFSEKNLGSESEKKITGNSDEKKNNKTEQKITLVPATTKKYSSLLEEFDYYITETKTKREYAMRELKLTDAEVTIWQKKFIAECDFIEKKHPNMTEILGHFINWSRKKIKLDNDDKNRITNKDLNVPENSKPVYKKSR